MLVKSNYLKLTDTPGGARSTGLWAYNEAATYSLLFALYLMGPRGLRGPIHTGVRGVKGAQSVILACGHGLRFEIKE